MWGFSFWRVGLGVLVPLLAQLFEGLRRRAILEKYIACDTLLILHL
jgi:hypothetical protein